MPIQASTLVAMLALTLTLGVGMPKPHYSTGIITEMPGSCEAGGFVNSAVTELRL